MVQKHIDPFDHKIAGPTYTEPGHQETTPKLMTT